MFDNTEKTWERQLVERCLSGDQRAWTNFCEYYKPFLVRAFRARLGRYAFDEHLIEERIQEIWGRLADRNFRRLRAYDPNRGGLRTFLVALVREQIQLLHRQQQRRHGVRDVRLGSHEPLYVDQDGLVNAMIGEFAETLSPALAHFFEEGLLRRSRSDFAPSGSSAKARKLAQRLRRKLEVYLGLRKNDEQS